MCCRSPVGGLNLQLLRVRAAQFLPAEIESGGAADRPDGRPVEQVLGDVEAEVPSGGHLRHQVMVANRVPKGQPGARRGGDELPPEQVGTPRVLEQSWLFGA